MGGSCGSEANGKGCGVCVNHEAVIEGTAGRGSVDAYEDMGDEGESVIGKDFKWLNYALHHMWPDLEQAVLHVVETQMIPKLKAGLPENYVEDVKFSKFTLGRKSPVLGPVKVTSLPQGSARVRMHIVYESDMAVEMALTTTKFGTLECGIKELSVSCDVVLRFNPFIESNPGTGGVSCYLLNEPAIDFNFTGHAQFVNSIGIKKIVLDIVDDAISSKVVMPHIVTQLIGFTDFKVYPLLFESPEPLGMLRLTLVEATFHEQDKLKIAAPPKRKPWLKSTIDKFRKRADAMFEYVDNHIGHLAGVNVEPYFRICLGDQVWKPMVKDLGSIFEFTVFDPEQDIRVGMWDRDIMGSDDIMCEAKLGIAEVCRSSGKKLYLDAVDGEHQYPMVWKAEFFEATPGKLGPAGGLVFVTVRELKQTNKSVASSHRFIVKGSMSDKVLQTGVGIEMKNRIVEDALDVAMDEIRDNLLKQKVPKDVIDKALEIKEREKRIAINTALHFHVKDSDVDDALMNLSLVELIGNPKDKKNIQEKVVGQESIKLSELKASSEFSLVKDITFYLPQDVEIFTQVNVNLVGLSNADIQHIEPYAETDKVSAEATATSTSKQDNNPQGDLVPQNSKYIPDDHI